MKAVFCLCLSLFTLPPGALVDRVVAVVDKEVITHSELLREARVALVMREGPAAASTELPRAFLDSFLSFLIDQVIIAGQARRLGTIEISEDDVERQVEAFAVRFSSDVAYRAFLRRFDISEEALGDILRRDLRNERYIARRMRAFRVGRRSDDTQSGIDYEHALREWLDELREGVELRILSSGGELELQR